MVKFLMLICFHDVQWSAICSKLSWGVIHKQHLQGGPKNNDPLLYQNMSVFWAFPGLFLTKCDKNHKFWIFLAYKLDFGAILAVHRSFHEAYQKIGCYSAKNQKFKKAPILFWRWPEWLCVSKIMIFLWFAAI